MTVSTLLRFVPKASTLAAMLGLASMGCYPGGTPYDHSTVGYSESLNFLSDLGMTVAYNGMTNRAGALLFVLSLLLLVATLSIALGAFIRIYRHSTGARPFTLMAIASGLTTAAAFVAVAMTPENAVMDVHVAVTTLAFRLFPVATLCLGIAALRSRYSDKIVVSLWFALTAVLTAFVALITWGPGSVTPTGLLVNVVAQKIVAVTVVLTIPALSIRTARLLSPPVTATA